MRRLGTTIDALVYEHLAVAWVPSLAILALVALCSPARELLPLQISGQQTTLYTSIAAISTTLLGFLLAVIALLAGLPERPFIHRLREQGMLERAVRQVGRACFAMGLTIVAAVLGLIVDHPPAKAAQEAAQLGCGSYWIWIVVVTAIPAATLLILSTATVIKTVTLATRDGEA